MAYPDDQIAIYEAEYGHPWPNCATPDCENKRCCWSLTGHCFPCAEQLIGRDDLIRRYDASHDITWEESHRMDAEDDPEDE